MLRITKQRLIILKCLSETKRPLSIEEILTYTSKEIPSINLSTIYRNIKILVESNKIAYIELPGEKICYEIINSEHHHFFFCDGCNKVYSVSGCPHGLQEMVPKGFKLLKHSITLNGLCLDCQPN